jgi:hypothetical protein
MGRFERGDLLAAVPRDARADAGEGFVGDGVGRLIENLDDEFAAVLMTMRVILGISIVPPLVVSSRRLWYCRRGARTR